MDYKYFSQHFFTYVVRITLIQLHANSPSNNANIVQTDTTKTKSNFISDINKKLIFTIMNNNYVSNRLGGIREKQCRINII